MVIANSNILTGNSHSEIVSIWLTLRNSVVTCPVPIQDENIITAPGLSRQESSVGPSQALPSTFQLDREDLAFLSIKGWESLGHSLCIIEIAAHRIQGEVVGKKLCK